MSGNRAIHPAESAVGLRTDPTGRYNGDKRYARCSCANCKDIFREVYQLTRTC